VGSLAGWLQVRWLRYALIVQRSPDYRDAWVDLYWALEQDEVLARWVGEQHAAAVPAVQPATEQLKSKTRRVTLEDQDGD